MAIAGFLDCNNVFSFPFLIDKCIVPCLNVAPASTFQPSDDMTSSVPSTPDRSLVILRSVERAANTDPDHRLRA